MLRDKQFVEYPLAKTIREAVEFMKNGGDVWQEDSNEFPICGGFDDVDVLMENFPEEDWNYDTDEQDLFLHLVPANADDDKAAPFKVGESAWAMEELIVDVEDDTRIYSGTAFKIIDIHTDGKLLRLDKYADIWWSVDKFCRCVLPVYTEKK